MIVQNTRLEERAVCENRNAFHWAVAGNAGEERYRDSRIFYTMAKGPGPIRLISGVKLDPADADASFLALFQKMRSGLLPQNLTVDLLCEPLDIGERLKREGAIPREQTLMYLDLAKEPASAFDALNSPGKGCSVDRIGAESLREWTELPTRWLWLGDETMLERNVRLYGPSLADSRFTFFAVRKEGKIVSTALLFCDRDSETGNPMAGVYAVATPESQRGNGYGSLATRACVLEAQKQDFPGIVLYATALGLPVYEKIGFRTVGKAVTWRIDPKPA